MPSLKEKKKNHNLLTAKLVNGEKFGFVVHHGDFHEFIIQTK